jgi:hypothetical protein
MPPLNKRRNQFCHHLRSAAFVSFDEEMTGIRLGAETEPVCVDGAATRYRKMRRIAQHFSLLQVGLCLWERDSSSSSLSSSNAAHWVARPFNFFVFPATAPAGINPIVRMETEAIEFNCRFDMDFNKWIRHGVPYVNAAEERRLHEHYFGTAAEQKQAESWESSPPLAVAAEEADAFPSPAPAAAASSAEPAPAPAPSPAPASKAKRAFVGTLNDADRECVRVACAAIDAWLPTASKELQLPDCNSFLRAVLYPARSVERDVCNRPDANTYQSPFNFSAEDQSKMLVEYQQYFCIGKSVS